MGKRILGLVVVVVVLGMAYLGYQKYRDGQNESGDIHGDTSSLSTSNDAASDSAPQRSQPAVIQPQQPVAQATTMAAPASDSISPNPANGMAYAGSGKFQVYRQGNLTWRVDTATGHACILFATMEEWKKPIVYSNGCNNNG
jgi:hypothetical protein